LLNRILAGRIDLIAVSHSGMSVSIDEIGVSVASESMDCQLCTCFSFNIRVNQEMSDRSRMVATTITKRNQRQSGRDYRNAVAGGNAGI
jgi:hypothetical protein